MVSKTQIVFDVLLVAIFGLPMFWKLPLICIKYFECSNYASNEVEFEIKWLDLDFRCLKLSEVFIVSVYLLKVYNCFSSFPKFFFTSSIETQNVFSEQRKFFFLTQAENDFKLQFYKALE